MLTYELLGDHEGLLLKGDYTTLRLLRSVVMDVNERSPVIKDKEGAFAALAYDVRKAYEQQREIFPPPEVLPEIGPMYGVGISWPVLLIRHQMLRVSLAYIDHTKWYQAITYALEAVVEDGLREDFGQNAQAIIDQCQRLHSEDAALLDRVDELADKFISWDAKHRAEHLIDLLAPAWIADYKSGR